MAEITAEVGQAVTYTDPRGRKHNALVTAIWGIGTPTFSVNLVYVVAEEDQSDQYGRQIARDTSVVHRSAQPAHGRYWD